MRYILIACALLVLAVTVQAETKFTFDGQVRARPEATKRRFAPDSHIQMFTDLRTRLGAKGLFGENTFGYIQFQDSRRLGGQTPTGHDVSGTLVNGFNVDVHEVFVQIKQLWQGGLGIQLGRYEVNLGDQRLFGSVGWHNVGRSWEGTQLLFDQKSYKIAGYLLKQRELDDFDSNRDFDIFLLNTWLKNAGAELLAVWEHNANTLIDTTDSGINALDRVTLAAHATRKFGEFDYILNAAYQLGDQRRGLTEPFTSQDISAYLITLETGWTVNPDNKARLALGIDYASGDTDPGEGTFKAFNNLYYTGHKSRGFMDYFLVSNPSGLLDLYLRGKIEPGRGWLLLADIHYFNTAQDPVNDPITTSRNLGWEIDVTAWTVRIPGATFQTGGSIFLPTKGFGGEDPEPGYWLYTMFLAGFSTE